MADPMGSKAFPILVGIVATICGVFLIVRPDPDPDWPAARTFLALGFTVIVLVAYAYTLKPLGFLIPTAIAAGIISFQISPRPVPAVLSGLGLSIGLFLIFKFALGLSLQGVPKGWM
ncbi:MAG: tripartite tricarboxylate transporter TctB family protein [Hoeflea sp.]|uniref:tripartite tricarboxylate transporter TctB family protein n=1 Tax=Hoeflea sp. TaxID=1940281 RepID=UPI003EFB3B77